MNVLTVINRMLNSISCCCLQSVRDENDHVRCCYGSTQEKHNCPKISHINELELDSCFDNPATETTRIERPKMNESEIKSSRFQDNLLDESYDFINETLTDPYFNDKTNHCYVNHNFSNSRENINNIHNLKNNAKIKRKSSKRKISSKDPIRNSKLCLNTENNLSKNFSEKENVNNFDSSENPPNVLKRSQKEFDLQSLDAESGYGVSLDESFHSTSIVVTVHKSRSKATYKLNVDTSSKCWIVYRRKLDFLYMVEYLKQQFGYDWLTIDDKDNTDELQNIVDLMVNSDHLLQREHVRTFFHLDRHDSTSTSGESEDCIQLDFESNLEEEKENDNKYANTKIQDIIETSNNRLQFSNTSPCDFEIKCLIGKGSFGKVVLAKKKDEQKMYAVKILNKKQLINRNEAEHVKSEKIVLTKLIKHPYFVQLHYAFATKHRIFFVLEYVNGGELFYHLQREIVFSEERTRFYAAEICSALTYIHLQGIIYRDLKPENILLDREGHIVLTDFGLCKEGLTTSKSKTGTFCGTPEYLAPEIILKKAYTRSVDWWTFGAVLYEMMYGRPPFYYKNVAHMYNAIVNEPLVLKASISNKARDLLYLLLHKSASQRLGAGRKDGIEVMKHSFFKSIDWHKIENKELEPPFVPNVIDEEDTSNIDSQFTHQSVQYPMCYSKRNSVNFDDSIFNDFQFVSPCLQNH